MVPGSQPAGSARPVADAPLAGLPGADDLARGWLLTLLAGMPLAGAASVPAAEFARDAPPLCAAVAAALASDEALARLEPGGDLAPLAARAGRIAGAPEPAGAAGAVAALRAALWAELTGALRAGDGALVADLAARLGRACDVVLAAVLAGDAPSGPHPAAAADPARLSAVPEPGEPAAPATVPADVFPSAAAGPAVEDRHEPWAAAVRQEAARGLGAGEPVAVLSVEVVDSDRLLAADLHGEARAALERLEEGLRALLRTGDVAIREREGRLWVVSPGTALDGARELGRRMVRSAEWAPELHGAPLRITIGIAVGPEDGTDADTLLARADERAFAARAAGLDLV